jgi:hypothetical protein
MMRRWGSKRSRYVRLAVEPLEPRCLLAAAPDVLFRLSGNLQVHLWVDPPYHTFDHVVGSESASSWDHTGPIRFGDPPASGQNGSKGTAADGKLSGFWNTTLDWDTAYALRGLSQPTTIEVYVRGPSGTPYDIHWTENGKIQTISEGPYSWLAANWTGARLDRPPTCVHSTETTGTWNICGDRSWSGLSVGAREFPEHPGVVYSLAASEVANPAVAVFGNLYAPAHILFDVSAQINIEAHISDIRADTLVWSKSKGTGSNTVPGGVDFTYSVDHRGTLETINGALYWSNDKKFQQATDTLANDRITVTAASPTPLVHINGFNLSVPPPNTSYLTSIYGRSGRVR